MNSERKLLSGSSQAEYQLFTFGSLPSTPLLPSINPVSRPAKLVKAVTVFWTNSWMKGARLG